MSKQYDINDILDVKYIDENNLDSIILDVNDLEKNIVEKAILDENDLDVNDENDLKKLVENKLSSNIKQNIKKKFKLNSNYNSDSNNSYPKLSNINLFINKDEIPDLKILENLVSLIKTLETIDSIPDNTNNTEQIVIPSIGDINENLAYIPQGNIFENTLPTKDSENSEKYELLYRHLVITIFTVISLHKKLLLENNSYAIVIKQLFDEFITNKEYYELVKIYNEIYTDNIYTESVILNNTVPQNYIYNKIKEYENRIREEKTKTWKNIKTYQIDEIVGIRDTDGKWWMGKVLDIFEHEKTIIYYVNYVGWGNNCNEAIISKSRIEKFNPYRHKYAKPVLS